MNTLILLTSGSTVTWAHHAILHGDRKGAIQGLALTIALGVSFTCVQAYEYSHAAFTFGMNGAHLGPLTDAAHCRCADGWRWATSARFTAQRSSWRRAFTARM